MRLKLFSGIIILIIMASCATIPKETVTLSQTIGEDLRLLQNSHRKIIELYYSGIKDDINTFIDDTYSPFIINYVLNSELQAYKKGEHSLYGVIEAAGKEEGKQETKEALEEMTNFQKAAHKQIEAKRKELLTPILNQEKEILESLHQSYQYVLYANFTITNYLLSVEKTRDAQSDALSMIGLSGADCMVSETLIETSRELSGLIEKGREIDIKSDQAFEQFEQISFEIKELINKN